MSCACGCGGAVGPDARGRPRRYVHGHNRARLVGIRKPDAALGIRQRHVRSAELKPSGGCEWEPIGGCKGPIHVAHVNGDDSDNRLSNLKRLCASHHFLLDRGRIDPTDPVMPAFDVSSSGKRRYGTRRRSTPTCRAWSDGLASPRCRLPRGHEGDHDSTAPLSRELVGKW